MTLPVKLSETAMRIYVYIDSRSGDGARLRDIQQAMKFQSPSSALFHLQKLEGAGLVLKDPQGNYHVKTRVRVSLTRNFVVLRGRFIPRHLLYALVTSILSVLYLILLRDFLVSPLALIVLSLNLVSVGLFWYETWQDWETKPRFS